MRLAIIFAAIVAFSGSVAVFQNCAGGFKAAELAHNATANSTAGSSDATLSAEPASSTLANYWAGKAEWKYEKKLVTATATALGFPASFGEGSQITVGPDGVWYLFSRHLIADSDSTLATIWGSDKSYQQCGFAGGHAVIGTDVRKSTDKGTTWSTGVLMVFPSPGSPWECMGGDGSA